MKIKTLALVGLDVYPVTIDVKIKSSGHGQIEITGMLDVHARETSIRVKSALVQAGLGHDLSGGNDVTVHVHQDHVPKHGTPFDLAIAACILAMHHDVPQDQIAGTLFLGSLSLTGKVEPMRGALPLLLKATEHGFERAVVSANLTRNGIGEPIAKTGLEVCSVSSLSVAYRSTIPWTQPMPPGCS